MSQAVILQHAGYQGAGRIVPVFRDYGIGCEVRHLYTGDEVPTDLDEIRVLVVLSGPMSVSDVGSDAYPYLAKEVETLKRMVSADRPVLGIGLGAQLLAHAAGAKVYANTRGKEPEVAGEIVPEYGWGPVTFPFPGGTDPVVFGLHDGAEMFHWHWETFDLPKLAAPATAPPVATTVAPTGSLLLSSSRTCRNQAFRFKNRLYGFQYHFELTADIVEGMLAVDSKAAERFVSDELKQRIRDETKQKYNRYARLGHRILENFVQYLRAYT